MTRTERQWLQELATNQSCLRDAMAGPGAPKNCDPIGDREQIERSFRYAKKESERTTNDLANYAKEIYGIDINRYNPDMMT